MTDAALEAAIEQAWERRAELSAATKGADREAVEAALDLLDSGKARVAAPTDKGWVVHQWLKKAVLLSFRLNDMSVIPGRAGRRDLVGQGAARSSQAGARPNSAPAASARCRAPSCAGRPISRRTSC